MSDANIIKLGYHFETCLKIFIKCSLYIQAKSLFPKIEEKNPKPTSAVDVWIMRLNETCYCHT